MYLEFFCIDKNGLPITELFKLESHSIEEIKATIAGAASNFLLDFFDPRLQAERKKLNERMAESEAGQRRVSQSDAKALAAIEARISRAATWHDVECSVLLSTDTADNSKVLVWRGLLSKVFWQFAEMLKNIELKHSQVGQEYIGDLEQPDGVWRAPEPPKTAIESEAATRKPKTGEQIKLSEVAEKLSAIAKTAKPATVKGVTPPTTASELAGKATPLKIVAKK